MYRGHTIATVVPAYNERGLITDVLASIPTFVDRVYVVDDCSTDGTYEEVRQYVERASSADDGSDAVDDDATEATGGREFPGDRIVTIRHERNRGAGAAIKTGYLHALADGIDVTATIDGDGQMDPRALSTVVAPVVEGTADYAKGNRLVGASERGDMPAFRWVGNWLLTGLTKVASGYWGLRDPQNGYTAISHDALAAIDVEDVYEYYGYCNDVLVRLNAAEQRVADVPMPAAYGDEESAISYHEYVPRVSSMLARTFRWRLRVKYLDGRVHPLAVAYLLAFASVVVGVGSALLALASGGAGADAPVGGVTVVSALLACGLFATVGMALDWHENRSLGVRLR